MGAWRNRISTELAGIAVILSMPGTLQAKETALTPTSPWHVDWAPASCTLRRAFGTEEQPVVLSIERFAPGDTFQMLILANQLNRLTPDTPLTLFLGPGKGTKITRLTLGSFKTKKGRMVTSIFFSRLSLADPPSENAPPLPVTPAMEAAASSISLHWLGKSFTLATGPMDKAFGAMRTCTDNLVKSWGLDPAQQANLASPPLPRSSPASWIRSSDYPMILLHQGKQALVNFLLLVDNTGRPTKCQIQRSYNEKQFDDVTCAMLMKRANFAPARDSEGQPMASYYNSTVHWIMTP